MDKEIVITCPTCKIDVYTVNVESLNGIYPYPSPKNYTAVACPNCESAQSFCEELSRVALKILKGEN